MDASGYGRSQINNRQFFLDHLREHDYCNPPHLAPAAHMSVPYAPSGSGYQQQPRSPQNEGMEHFPDMDILLPSQNSTQESTTSPEPDVVIPQFQMHEAFNSVDTYSRIQKNSVVYGDQNAMDELLNYADIIKKHKYQGTFCEGIILNKALEVEQPGNYIENIHFSSTEISKGNFGAVTSCVDRKKGTKFACKRQSLKSFRREEVEIVLRFMNTKPGADCFPRVYGVILDRDFIKILMEYVDLTWFEMAQSYKNQHMPRDEKVIVDLLKQALVGLSVLQLHHIVHCDIKPENLGYTIHGKVKIIDFGTVRLSEQNFTHCGMTGHYMAPEACRRISHINSDTWSLACSVIFLLTFSHPWWHISKEQTIVIQKIPEIAADILYFVNYCVEKEWIGSLFASLLKEMFKADPDERITAAKALKHPVFEILGTGNHTPLSSLAPIHSGELPTVVDQDMCDATVHNNRCFQQSQQVQLQQTTDDQQRERVMSYHLSHTNHLLPSQQHQSFRTVHETYQVPPQQHNVVPQQHNVIPQQHNVMRQQHNVMSQQHNVMPQYMPTSDEISSIFDLPNMPLNHHLQQQYKTHPRTMADVNQQDSSPFTQTVGPRQRVRTAEAGNEQRRSPYSPMTNNYMLTQHQGRVSERDHVQSSQHSTTFDFMQSNPVDYLQEDHSQLPLTFGAQSYHPHKHAVEKNFFRDESADYRDRIAQPLRHMPVGKTMVPQQSDLLQSSQFQGGKGFNNCNSTMLPEVLFSDATDNSNQPETENEAMDVREINIVEELAASSGFVSNTSTTEKVSIEVNLAHNQNEVDNFQAPSTSTVRDIFPKLRDKATKLLRGRPGNHTIYEGKRLLDQSWINEVLERDRKFTVVSAD